VVPVPASSLLQERTAQAAYDSGDVEVVRGRSLPLPPVVVVVVVRLMSMSIPMIVEDVVVTLVQCPPLMSMLPLMSILMIVEDVVVTLVQSPPPLLSRYRWITCLID